MVLCHLLANEPSNNQNQNPEQTPIIKILGKVLDIQKGSRYIEKVDERQALRADTNILIVKAENREGVYQVDSRACMLVRDETPKEREDRLYPKIKEGESEEDEEKPIIIDEEDKIEFIESSKKTIGMEIQDKPAIDENQYDNVEIQEPVIEKTVHKKEEIKIDKKPEDVIEKKEEISIQKEIVKPQNQTQEIKENPTKPSDSPSFFDYIR